MSQALRWRDALAALIVVAVAGAARVGYVMATMEDGRQPIYQVQDRESAVDLNHEPNNGLEILVANIAKKNSFSGPAPFSGSKAEATAHVAPAYPFLIGYASRWLDDPATTTRVIIWTQCGLGALTAMLFMLLARLQFGSTIVGLLAGLLTALHPFWIVNVAELQDGTLASFAVACCLFLGTFAADRASPLASFAFGLALAGMALVRAALLPFAFIGCALVLLRFRHQPRSWLCALLVVLGFGNGLAPWTVRNYQTFGEIVPVSDSLFLHLWLGNYPGASGGEDRWDALWVTSNPARREALAAETNQARRYRMMADEVRDGISSDPAATIRNRCRSGLCFLFGAAWFSSSNSQLLYSDTTQGPFPWSMPTVLAGTLLFMIVFGLLGWRWSYGWSRQASLTSLAMIWIPLPYVLSHAEQFSGPRLPLDGVLLCYAAFALIWIVPGGRRLACPPPN